MTAPNSDFAVGDDVFFREPRKVVEGCTSITGVVTFVTDGKLSVDATVVTIRNGEYAFEKYTLSALPREVGHRLGASISRLSGRPGHSGFEEFCRIATSYGYD